MAASGHIHGGMYGISLKPRLLRSLIKEKLPDEKHPFRDNSELLHVAATIRTHSLLSESDSLSADQNEMENWKSVVDSWVNRLMLLVSMDLPDKCWAGICMLGVTCEECSSERFLTSYSGWFSKLLSRIQSPGESHFVMVAACASLSDLLRRLSGFSNLKKDGTSHAGKVIQPALKMLNEENSDTAKDGAICLLYTVVTLFPASVHRHYDSVEAAVVSNIMSGKCSVGLLKKLGHCLALLPKSKGDEDSWLLMMRKILIAINVQLTDAFQGLEEESKNDEAVRSLIPLGNDPPPPLGGLAMPISSYTATKRPELLLMRTVSTLVDCCYTMLTCSYPVQVNVPVQSIVLLARRTLMFDGSVSPTNYPLMSTMQQELICSELPVLHLHILELLTATVKGVRSQLLPHVADIAQLVTEYFRKCVLPELRIRVYSVIRALLLSFGVGMSLYLTEDIINNAFVDLDYISYTNTDANVSYEALQQPAQKKRKHAGTAASLGEQPDRIDLEMIVPKIPTSISVKIAALHTLEALLTVGGAVKSTSWRPELDRFLVAIAIDACKGGWAKEEKNVFLPNGHTNPLADFQLAAFKALLASLLSPGRVRPPFLSQGLELFRRGLQETGTKLFEFCSHALLALEALIHPRALALVDFASDANVIDGVKLRIPQSIYSGDQKFTTLSSGGTLGKRNGDPESDDDDLYKSWLGNDDVVAVAETHTEKNTDAGAGPSYAFEQPMAENRISADDVYRTEVPEISGRRPVPAGVMKGIEETSGFVKRIGDNRGDEVMTERRTFQDTTQRSVETTGYQAFQDITQHSVEVTGYQAQTFGTVSASSIIVQSDSIVGGHNVLPVGGQNITSDEKMSITSSNIAENIGFVVDHNAESPEESIPDIVDEEPDSE